MPPAGSKRSALKPPDQPPDQPPSAAANNIAAQPLRYSPDGGKGGRPREDNI